MAEAMGDETFILRAARVTTHFPEADLFEGLE
jgi:hypothetical protein